MIEQKYYLVVSVIIPMFNAGKYVADCLESLLAQTFQNFEVIIVDDCSTDNSVDIVKSYAQKFGGRLNIYHMDKNSGSGALPRNKGVNFSRGEYIFFMDADDVILPTALEELYTLAKNFDADVVSCEKYYTSTGTGQEFLNNIRFAEVLVQTPPFVDKPIFETYDLAERVKGILMGRFLVTPWSKFVRRNLIFEYEIFFPHCKISEDDIWTYGLVFYAKRFLRVPNVIYILRMSETSVSGIKKTPQQTINFWLNPVLLGLKSLDNLLSRHEFFKKDRKYRYAVLEAFLCTRFKCFFQESMQLSPFEIYWTIKETFGEKLSDYNVLISTLCAVLNAYQKVSFTTKQNSDEAAAQAQARISELEKINLENKAYISALEKFIIESNRKDG